MENKDLTARKREAIFILKNENKTYTEITKLLKISSISVYYTLKNFETSFSSPKNQSDRRRKTTKNDDDKIVIISKQNRHPTASDITSEMNQNLPMYASCIQRSQIWIHRCRKSLKSSNIEIFSWPPRLQVCILTFFLSI
jgi:transposase